VAGDGWSNIGSKGDAMKRLLISGVLAALAMVGGSVAAQNAKPAAPTLVPQPAARTALPDSPAATTLGGSHELTRADLDAWLDGYVPAALANGDIAGAVVTVVKDGQILTARGFGYADADKRTPVDPDRTLFRPGSVSKLFTWIAVMQQVEARKLDLDADVNAYLDFKIPPRDGKPATLRQILTHTAGFEEFAKGVIFYDAKYLKPLGGYLKSYTPRRIYEPGTTPAYSNWATALAGYIVERTSGEPFDTYVERHIFAPLGMRNSTFRQPLPQALSAQMSSGYGKPGEKANGFEIVGPAPAGSLSSTGTDMARFMIANLQGGALDGQRILSEQTMKLMHNSPLDRVDPVSLVPPLNRMELGYFEINLNGYRAVGHLGDTNAFHTSLDLLLDHGLGIYVSVNSAGKEGAGHKMRISLPEDFAARYLPAPAPTKQGVSAEDAKKHAQMMTGLWEATRRGDTSFLSLLYFIGQTKVGVNAEGGLVIPDLLGPNGRPREWVEIAPFVWKDKNGQERLAATVVDGKVHRWAFDLVSSFEVFDRVPFGKSSGWIMPSLYASLAVLFLTFIFWPIGWFVRRRYAAPLNLKGRSLGVYRATRIMAGLDLAVLIGWGVLATSLLGSLAGNPAAADPALWVLQVVGAIVFVGAVGIAGWNVWLTWTDGRRWARKAWSLLVLLSMLLLLYVAWRFGLIAMTVNY
jgi:CubicO group peptidase (beta-lactamase class C family)